VEAKCAGWTKFYKGEITSVNRDGSYDIKFEDGERKRSVESERVRPLDLDNNKYIGRSSSTKIREGDNVEAKYAGWTKFYKGEITSVNRDGSYDIKFEDGERKRSVEAERVRPLDLDSNKDIGRSSSTKIREGDNVEAKCAGWTKFYKGEVTCVNGDGTFDIKFEDGERKLSVEARRVKAAEASSSNPYGSGASSRKSPRIQRPSLSPRAGNYARGDRIEAQLPGWTKYYRGEVSLDNGDGTYAVKFDDGEFNAKVSAQRMRKDPSSSSSSVSSSPSFELRERVEAKLKGWTKYYPGIITKVYGADGTYDIKFDDGERGVDVSGVMVRSLGKPHTQSATTKYKEGDNVEAKVQGWTKWYPGVVVRARRDSTYDIMFEDGERKTNVDMSQMRMVSRGGGGGAGSGGRGAGKESSGSSSRNEHSGGHSRSRHPKFTKNQRVRARSSSSSSWKRARISRTHPDGVYDVKYDTGMRELRVEASNLQAIEGAGGGGGLGSLGSFEEGDEEGGW
jgi:hypothetical protein